MCNSSFSFIYIILSLCALFSEKNCSACCPFLFCRFLSVRGFSGASALVRYHGKYRKLQVALNVVLCLDRIVEDHGDADQEDCCKNAEKASYGCVAQKAGGRLGQRNLAFR